ncbi:MAG TPA: hypothetical protein VG165_15245 [Solirubrobacteraceae bacterium]|jgi:hypothetical protein|nr:hypothetical protein [Solirubrobacteraceae bacterium]
MGADPPSVGRSVLGRLRAGLLAEPTLAARLRATTSEDELASVVIGAAGEQGWVLDRAAVAEAVAQARRERLRQHAGMAGRPGRATWVGTAVGEPGPLPALCPATDVTGASPIGIGVRCGELVVEWCDLRGVSFDDPFFGMTVSRALAEPYRALTIRYTGLDALLALDDAVERSPDCLIFHVSRCGSTLLSRVLGALPGASTISEAPAIDVVIGAPGIDTATRLRALRALVGALGCVEGPAAGPRVVKLDAWAIHDLQLLSQAFPNTPRVFLYRDPREVIASQMRMRGIQMIPGAIGRNAPPAGMHSGEEFCAAVIDGFAQAALAGLRDADLLVSYDELPGAVLKRVMPHIGIAPSPSAIERIRATALRDAKAPEFPFEALAHAAERPITARIEGAARRLAWSSYERLERRRLAQLAAEPLAR